MDLVYIIAYTTFYHTQFICSEDNEEKYIFTSMMGHNYVVYPKPLLPDINVCAKFEENRLKIL